MGQVMYKSRDLFGEVEFVPEIDTMLDNKRWPTGKSELAGSTSDHRHIYIAVKWNEGWEHTNFPGYKLWRILRWKR
jgi:hypothetical protein